MELGGVFLKKLIMGLLLLTVLSGCGKVSNEVVKVTEDSILYTGTVIAGGESNEKSLLLSELNPISNNGLSSIGEVVLLMDGVEIVDQATGKELLAEEIKKGDEVQVELIKDYLLAESYPAQLSGSSVIKVEKVN